MSMDKKSSDAGRDIKIDASRAGRRRSMRPWFSGVKFGVHESAGTRGGSASKRQYCRARQSRRHECCENSDLALGVLGRSPREPLEVDMIVATGRIATELSESSALEGQRGPASVGPASGSGLAHGEITSRWAALIGEA